MQTLVAPLPRRDNSCALRDLNLPGAFHTRQLRWRQKKEGQPKVQVSEECRTQIWHRHLSRNFLSLGGIISLTPALIVSTPKVWHGKYLSIDRERRDQCTDGGTRGRVNAGERLRGSRLTWNQWDIHWGKCIGCRTPRVLQDGVSQTGSSQTIPDYPEPGRRPLRSARLSECQGMCYSLGRR